MGKTVLAVSTHSRPKAAGNQVEEIHAKRMFQHTAARRRLGSMTPMVRLDAEVSTHSRPKAAGPKAANCCTGTTCFNTQPPEGGWGSQAVAFVVRPVSTHSRPKAAGASSPSLGLSALFQHTAARRRLVLKICSLLPLFMVSTHSRPKAAGRTRSLSF